MECNLRGRARRKERVYEKENEMKVSEQGAFKEIQHNAEEKRQRFILRDREETLGTLKNNSL